MRCRPHRVAYTLYPQGHVPYGRVAIAPVSSTGGAGTAGEVLFAADDPIPARMGSAIAATAVASGLPDAAVDSESPPRCAPDWDVTVFEAARDAADGGAWSRGTEAEQPKRRRTQVRHIALCVSILGLLCAPAERLGIADALGIALLGLSDASKAFAAASGIRERGRVVCDALGLLVPSRSLGDRLLIAGAMSRCWGTPARCDPRSGHLLTLSDSARAPP